MNVAFRADSGSMIGAGHVSRCLTLADALSARGARCHFVMRDQPGNMADTVLARGHGVTILPRVTGTAGRPVGDAAPPHASWLGCAWEADAEETLAILEKIQPHWMVVDHYALDSRWEKAVRPRVRRIMAIDDLADRGHDCDLLVDPGVDPALPGRYRMLTPPECCRWIGPRYSILRPEFEVARMSLDRLSEGGIPRRLVVLFGGDDASHSTLEALGVILRVTGGDLPVDVIVPATSKAKAEIAQFCAENQAFEMHYATCEIARLFARADFAIGAGGSATYERLYLRLPAILKPVAENQRVPLECLRGAGLIDTYADGDELAMKLAAVLEGGLRYPQDVVGNGVGAMADAIVDDLVSLRSPVPLDLRRTFHWLGNAGLRASFLMEAAPERRGHFAYWRKQLSDARQRIFSIYLGDHHVGNAGLKNLDPRSGDAELWLYLGEEDLRGRGIGARAVRGLERILWESGGFRKLYLHVGRSNAAALRLYRSAGFADAGPPDPATHPFAAPDDVLRMEKIL